MTTLSFIKTFLLLAMFAGGPGHNLYAQGNQYDHPSHSISVTNPETAKCFAEKYPAASDVRWYKKDHVFFKDNGKTVNAWFNKSGDFLYAVSYYDGEKLPAEILNIVYNDYYKFDIFGVTEVNVRDQTAYFVILENRTSFLKVKFIDGKVVAEDLMRKPA